jgi:drug/metabolite transporter (DMT)-like permease
MTSSARSSPLALVGLILVALSLGSGHVCARLAFTQGVGVMTAATTRSACACLLLLATLAFTRTLRLPRAGEWRAAVILGGLVVVQTVCIQLAVKWLPVALAVLVFYSYPFLTSLGMAATAQHPLARRAVIALLLAFGGLYLVLGVGTQPPSALGLAAGLGAAVAFSSILVLTPKLAPQTGAALRTFFMLSTAAAVFSTVTVTSGAWLWPDNTAAWAGLSGLGLFYAFGIVGLFLLLPHLGAVQTAVVLNLEPVAVAVIAFLALGERLTSVQVLGAATVVAAVMYYQLAGRLAARAR